MKYALRIAILFPTQWECVEVELMVSAGEIGAESFGAAIRQSRSESPLYEWSLGSVMELEARRRGAPALAYPPVIAAGNRANTIHYLANDNLVKPGDMVLMDSGVDYYGYVSDITRSWVPNGQPRPDSNFSLLLYRRNHKGKLSDAQVSLHEALEEVHKELISFAADTRPLTLAQIYFHMLLLIGKQLQRLGIFKSALSQGELRKKADDVCPHHVSHYLGMDVHDTPSIPRSIPLLPNVAFTIEPGIYFPSSCDWVPAEFRGIGLRLEDDVLFTESGLRLLSQPLTTNLIRLNRL